ncbi:MAG: putative DNA-binding domain-containing protein [Sulfurimicrobium sp.]|nr:putative DNA-binding domain-containing protein [Sulfurimicrobium sp.]
MSIVMADDLPAFQRYQYAFTAHIRNPKAHPRPQGAPAKRMKVYNELLYNNLEGFLLACFPVLRKVLGTRIWGRLVRDFFAEHRSHTPIFHQIPEEFVRYLKVVRGLRDGDPAFLFDLAHYEWVELALSVSPLEIDWSGIERTGDLLAGRPVLNPVLALLQYPYPVHRIGPRFKPTQEQTQETHILVFRNIEDQMRFIELNPVSARLVSLLQHHGMSGSEAMLQIAAELAHPDSRAVTSAGLAILENLKSEQAILGISSVTCA